MVCASRGRRGGRGVAVVEEDFFIIDVGLLLGCQFSAVVGHRGSASKSRSRNDMILVS